MEIIDLFVFFLTSFVSLFVIVNPFSATSVFLAISQGDSKAKKKRMVKRAAVFSFIILVVFVLFGSYILNFFSITVDAFRIAGGIIISGIGWKMIKAEREYLPTKEEKQDATDKEDVSIVPLAVPMLSGPGSITTSIVLASKAASLMELSVLIVAILVICIISYLILVKSDMISEYFGEVGMRVADRLMGLIVLVVGVQFIINGLAGVVGSW